MYFAQLIYKLGIHLLFSIARLLVPFKPKYKQWFEGQKKIFGELANFSAEGKKVLWFHFASTGEFEQGYPLLKKIHSQYPNIKIIITFFSSTGYKQKNRIKETQDIYFLPKDTPANVKRFLDKVKPDLAIFTRYEFWAIYFQELKKRSIPLYFINFYLNEKSFYLRFFQNWFKSILKNVTHFYCINETPTRQLKKMGLDNFTAIGDTRWDRVIEIAETPFSDALVEEFVKTEDKVLLSGSVWQTDIKILSQVYPFLQKKGYKLIIAPHEIDHQQLNLIKKSFPTVSFYSENSIQGNSQILCLDTIGILSRCYRYARMAWVGGGFDSDIHNIQEPSAYGIPTFIGTSYQKFPEAIELVEKECVFPLHNAESFIQQFEKAENNYENIQKTLQQHLEANKNCAERIITHPILRDKLS